MRTRIAAIVGLLMAFLFVGVMPANASFLNDAVIKNQSFSYTTLTVCKDAISDTQCGSVHGYLSPGQNTKSKYGWSDADGIWCGKGWWCKIDSQYVEGSGTGWNSKFVKISGCDGCTMYVYLFPDRS